MGLPSTARVRMATSDRSRESSDHMKDSEPQRARNPRRDVHRPHRSKYYSSTWPNSAMKLPAKRPRFAKFSASIQAIEQPKFHNCDCSIKACVKRDENIIWLILRQAQDDRYI